MLSDHNKFLEQAYRVLNKVYFEDKLPEVVITIQSSQKAYGHITTGKIWKDENDSYYEVNLSAEYLNRPVYNVIATLLHECCHLYAMENSIKDTSNGNRYHNKRFKEIAEQRDLKISYADTIGWSVTEPTERLINTIKKYGLDSQIDYFRMGAYKPTGGSDNNGSGSGSDGSNGKPPKKKSSTRKYICPKCRTSVRATKDVNIACLDCLLQMVKVE
ncbi:MAG: SprT-like domain-containing protein [Acetatifactor muris]|nr:SprT-like domain-containing protein [Acetatifactor muris]MCM1525728.1 SprT-like domain-containing protein [Bacteroides sp.]